MTEWGVVVVIIALAGLIVTIVKPIISLTKSITSLDDSVKTLQKAIDKNASDNEQDHKSIWAKYNEHSEKLGDHETRISVLENKN